MLAKKAPKPPSFVNHKHKQHSWTVVDEIFGSGWKDMWADWPTNPLMGNGTITCKYITIEAAGRNVQICLINPVKQHAVLLYFLHHMFRMMENDTRYTFSHRARWTFSPESSYPISFPDTSVDSPHREVNTSLSPWLYVGLFLCLYAHICRGTWGGMVLLKKTKTDSAVQARRC